MVSLQDSHNSNPGRLPITRPYYTPPPSSAASSPSRFQKHLGRSMRTVRSNFYQSEYTNSCSFASTTEPAPTSAVSENLTDSVIDVHLHQLATTNSKLSKSSASSTSSDDLFGLSQVFSDFSAYSSDISGELQRLACLPEDSNETDHNQEQKPEAEPCLGFLQRESFSTEIIENISPEDLQPTVKICVDSLGSNSVALKRSAAAKLRLLAKNRSENRALIGESGAVPALIPLLRCADPWTQEHAVTALLNLSLLDDNKPLIAGAGAVKSLIYVLKTGTEVSKQNAACALLSLAMIDENKVSIGACGAIPPLVSLLINGSNRGKKDALTTLYKLCSMKANKKRAVTAGVVKPLVELIVAAGEAAEEQGAVGMAEKAMVVLSSLAAVEEGKTAIVEEGGIAALVEVIEDGTSVKGKEFAVVTLLQLCAGANGGRNRGLLVGEGAIPPLVALSQTGTARAKHKERLRNSGCDDVQVLSRALADYQKKHPSGFTHIDAWNVVRKHDKWSKVPLRHETASEHSDKRRKSSEGGNYETCTPDDANTSHLPDLNEDNAPTRPNRKGKKPISGSSTYSVFEEYASKKQSTYEDLAEIKRRQAEESIALMAAQRAKVNQEIQDRELEFFCKPHEHLSGTRLELILNRKREIAAKYNWPCDF